MDITFAVSEKIVSSAKKKKKKERKRRKGGKTYVWLTQSFADSIFYHC